MTNLLIIAWKEIQEGLRNRWVIATTLLLAALALTLTFLGSAPTGHVGVQALDVVIVSLSSLSIFLLPLIALLLSHDAIVGEAERGTMILLLSYPISRKQVIAGKFIGHVGILAFATILGYGAAALALSFSGHQIGGESWKAFALMIATSITLGAAFIALGYLISTLVSERATAAGIAVGVWLFFVLIYDMALLGILVADQGKTISGGFLNTLLLLNPTDTYRLLNLTGSANVGSLSGMAGLSSQISLGMASLFGTLTLWILVPMTLATAIFSRREL